MNRIKGDFHFILNEFCQRVLHMLPEQSLNNVQIMQICHYIQKNNNPNPKTHILTFILN